MFFSKEFPLVDPNGQESGAVYLENLWAEVYAIKIKKSMAIQNAEPWVDTLREALKEAEQRLAREIIFLLIKNDGLEKLRPALEDIGFFKKNERNEFKRDVVDLPDDKDTPFFWKTCEQLNWDQKQIADVLALVAEGDPDSEPTDDPIQLIQHFLTDPVLTAGPNCIHIGFINGVVVAFSVVQINPKSGWSRISYMGIAPNYREQKLGRWVHRYSFKVMKDMGGKLYHGGTVSTNRPMIRLFETHGCEKFREMEEWRFKLNRGQA